MGILLVGVRLGMPRFGLILRLHEDGIRGGKTCRVTVEYNLRARRLYVFVFEGRFREDHYHDRKWYDVLFYSMLEHEWEAQRRLKTQEEVSPSVEMVRS